MAALQAIGPIVPTYATAASSCPSGFTLRQQAHEAAISARWRASSGTGTDSKHGSAVASASLCPSPGPESQGRAPGSAGR